VKIESYSYDPFRVILADDYSSVPTGRSAISDALEELQRSRNLALLKPLLDADTPGIVGIGLQLYSELDTWAYPLMPAALRNVGSLDWRDRLNIVNALLINHRKLSINEVAEGLRFLADEDSVVRWKSIELLLRIDPILLDEATRSLPGEHQHGRIVYGELARGKSVVLSTSEPSRVHQSYVCGGIVAAAKLGAKVEITDLGLSDEDLDFLTRRIARLRS